MDDARTRWATARQQLQDEGYTILPALIDPTEVVALRDVIQGHLGGRDVGIPMTLGRVEPLAAVEVPQIRRLISDPRVIDAVRGLLDVDRPVFTLHCDVHRNDLSSWHKDTGEQLIGGGYFGESAFDRPDCSVIKLAVYCQDHRDNAAGFRVRPGSHRYASLTAGGDPVDLRTAVGDVVAFDVRITHMGEPMHPYHQWIQRLAGRLPSGSAQRVTNAVRSSELRLHARPARISAFFSFGTGDELTTRFARTNLKRASEQAGVSPGVSKDVVDELQAAGVAISDLGTDGRQ